ncbi:hypothetical protein [Acinetobacter variabilis]|uniref:hypothetical protein n=1 Tax=Acinetobacter variabilis TaxID=70346 RepID=UPI0028A99179|nr:hypothetical protein [Acinetobacter variabilis]
MGSNTSTLDLNAVIKLVSGLMGGSTGNLDLSKIAELAGNLLQGGDLDLTKITQLLSGLIGGTGGLGGTDIGQIANLVGGLISGNAASDLDIGAIVDLISGLIGGSTGSLDTSSVNLLASNLMSNASSDLDIGAITNLLSGLISNSGNIDTGTIAQTVTQSLMPLLASIDTGNSSIDMDQLTQVLPTVVGSVTTLVSAISSAGSGNVPDTIADVLKGINPLLNLLANSDVLDADQAEIVNSLYDVLNGVQVVLDFVNNPLLLTLSSDLNNVITALKPVIALIDSEGQFSDLLDGVQFPEIGDLLGSLGSGVPSLEGLGLDAFTDSLGNLVGNNSSLQLPDLSELISGISNTDTATNISITEILPTIKETISNISSGSPLPKFDFSSLLSGFNKQSDIDLTNPWG